jgi:hypothetical protein
MGRATDLSNCYLYHIKSKDGVVHYVGSTSNLNSRKSSHRYRCNTEKCPQYHFHIYQYIRNNGGFDQFDIIPIRKIENVSNKTDLLIAEQTEMNKFSGLKNMVGSYLSEEERIENSKKYYESNREQLNQQIRQWQKNNFEKVKKSQRKYRETHREKLNEKQRQKRLQKKQLEAYDQ